MADTTINIDEVFKAEAYSPYKLAHVVNVVLVEFGLNKVPPQMLYQYTGPKQRIPTVNGETGKGRQVSRENAILWLAKYLSSKGVQINATETDPNQTSMEELVDA